MKQGNLLQIQFLIITLLVLGTACQSQVVCEGYTADDASWAEDSSSPDYHHLQEVYSETGFTFTAAELESLISSNHFSISKGPDEVLFGLRGCQVIGNTHNTFSTSVQLQETKPDHQEYQDVLGVWRQSTGEIRVFEGSTVPNWYYMCIQAEIGGHEANMLPTGRYIYQVDKHRHIEGAFRSEQEIVVLRSNDDLIFETSDDWEIWTPLDNIHPGGCPGEMFSSAGCQTIPGTFGGGCQGYYDKEPETHLGTWAEFRASAGLDPNNNQDRWEWNYYYVLLTCREARMASQGLDGEALSRLRFGSSGTPVLQLQQALLDAGIDPGPLDGIMGPKTAFALIQWQQAEFDGEADGILTPELAEILGFELK